MTIYFSFGKIYITTPVRTGEEMKDGVLQPILEIKKIYIGELEFSYNKNGVQVNNKDNPVLEGYPHPHATTRGLCYGRESNKMSELITNADLINLIKALYSWAHSYNSKDAYRKIEHWYNKQKRKEEGTRRMKIKKETT